jgi:hypothetical protein
MASCVVSRVDFLQPRRITMSAERVGSRSDPRLHALACLHYLRPLLTGLSKDQLKQVGLLLRSTDEKGGAGKQSSGGCLCVEVAVGAIVRQFVLFMLRSGWLLMRNLPPGPIQILLTQPGFRLVVCRFSQVRAAMCDTLVSACLVVWLLLELVAFVSPVDAVERILW